MGRLFCGNGNFLKGYRVLFTISYTLFCHSVIAQEIKIGRINDMNFLEMEISFIATNSDGEKNFSLQVKDFDVFENNQKTDVIEVINPEGEGRPVSVVLVFDVSASMKDERLALAKEAALGFLEKFPLETSEVAIASFSDNVFLNCDFTQDINRLTDAVSGLQTYSNTDYSKAFLFNQTGAMDIAKSGKYKKSIVFLTDGLSSAKTGEIIKRAISEEVSVYCISLELAMPDILKQISIQTGGRYYEAITNIYQLHNFYASICQLLRTSGMSLLRWRAINNCDRKRKVRLVCHGTPVEFAYEVPSQKIGFITTDPNILYFGKPGENISPVVTMDLQANNQPFNITNMSVTRKDYFSITDSMKYPFLLTPGEIRKFHISYNYKEAGLISDKLVISSLGCPKVYVSLNGGEEEKLKLINPAGGEYFPVGMDTAIIWEGIKRNKYVALSYRTSEYKPWIPIAEANGLYHQWVIPNDTGNRVQVKAEPVFSNILDFKINNRLTSANSLLCIYSNQDGSRILTVDKTGTLCAWDGNTSKILITLGGFNLRYAILSPDSRRIIGFTGFEMFVWDVQSYKLVARYTFRQKLYVSDVDPDGNESLLSTRIYKDINDKVKAWSPGSNVLIPIPEQKGLTSATVSQNGLRTITLDSDNHLKIWNLTDNSKVEDIHLSDDVTSVVISPNGQNFTINKPSAVKVYDIASGKERFVLDRNLYQKFTGTGQVLITKDYQSSLIFWDINKGQNLFKLSGADFYKVTNTKLLFYRKDSLIITDLIHKESAFKLYIPKITDAAISPDGSMLVVARNMDIMDFYDIAEQKKINSLGEFESPLLKLKFSADGKNILAITENNEILIFKPNRGKLLREAVSDYFTIVAPTIRVKDSICFFDQYKLTSKELMVSGFVSNIDRFPVSVLSMDVIGEQASDFELVSKYCPFSLQAKSAKDLEVRFTPASVGIKKAMMRTVTATDTFYTVLLGNGISKGFEIITESINLGKVKVNGSKDSLVAIIRNSGNSSVTIQSIRNIGPNKDVFKYPAFKDEYLLEPGKSFFLGLTFTPKYRGRVSGMLQVKLKECDELQNVDLLGEGLAARELIVTGRTLNSSSNKPIAAKVSCIDLHSGVTVNKFVTDSTGWFTLKLNTDRNYGITAFKEKFLSGSENVDLTGVIQKDTVYCELFLTEIRSGAFIRMNCIFFDFAKWNLLPESENELDRLVATLRRYPKMGIEIHGHTDSIGSNPFNLELSKNRANTVRNYLIKKGIAAGRLSVLFFGETVPVTSNTTEEDRARNRRVEVKVK